VQERDLRIGEKLAYRLLLRASRLGQQTARNRAVGPVGPEHLRPITKLLGVALDCWVTLALVGVDEDRADLRVRARLPEGR